MQGNPSRIESERVQIAHTDLRTVGVRHLLTGLSAITSIAGYLSERDQTSLITGVTLVLTWYGTLDWRGSHEFFERRCTSRVDLKVCFR